MNFHAFEYSWCYLWMVSYAFSIQSLLVPKLTLITLGSEGVGDDERLSLLVVLLFSLIYGCVYM